MFVVELLFYGTPKQRPSSKAAARRAVSIVAFQQRERPSESFIFPKEEFIVHFGLGFHRNCPVMGLVVYKQLPVVAYRDLARLFSMEAVTARPCCS
jgi:hypothetical protein